MDNTDWFLIFLGIVIILIILPAIIINSIQSDDKLSKFCESHNMKLDSNTATKLNCLKDVGYDEVEVYNIITDNKGNLKLNKVVNINQR